LYPVLYSFLTYQGIVSHNYVSGFSILFNGFVFYAIVEVEIILLCHIESY
jgi:hypothetical protein